MYHNDIAEWDEPHSSSQSFNPKPQPQPAPFPMFKGHKFYKKGKKRAMEFDGFRKKNVSFRKRFEDAGLMLDDRPSSSSPPPAAVTPDLREYLDTRKPKRSRPNERRSQGRSISPTVRSCYADDSDDGTTGALHKKLTALKEKYAEYENYPESHPKYQEEWRGYWKRRCEELGRFGINTDEYDFKPEWLDFWKRRLKELYKEDSDPIIESIREANERKERDHDERSWSSDNDEPEERPVLLRKSPTPEEKPRVQRSRTPILARTISIPGISADVHEDTFTITTALQTITNLEDGLSRIGPKVIDLVGKSLALIDGMDFNSFDRARDMPSAKEKLNGQILHNKIQSVLTTFENITSILRRMTESPSQSQAGQSIKEKNNSDDPMDTLNDDVKQWMSIFTDVLDNLDEKRSVDGGQFTERVGAEHLTDAEVEALLQNFDTLSEKEKNHLIVFLKNLEKTDEERVKRLRYFFNGPVNRALSTVPDSTEDHRWRDNSRSRSNSWSSQESRERSRSRPRKRPRTPSPIPEIFDNLHILYQEQFNDPFYSDVIESLKQPHWRAPREVEQFTKRWKGLKLHPESGALQINANGQDVYVIPDRIQEDVIEDFHRRRVRSGKMMCRSRAETVTYVRKYCFIQGYKQIVNDVVDQCKHCQQKRK